MPIRILLVDDHTVFRESLHSLLAHHLDFVIVGEARDGQAALEELKALPVDLVLMDLCMPRLSGVETTALIRKSAPRVKIVILSGYSVHPDTEAVIAAGASLCIPKTSGYREIRDSILSLFATSSPAEAEHPKTTPSIATGVSGCQKLSTRERQILGFIANGFMNRQISARLAVSVKTVETHRQNILRKLSIGSTAGLVKYAIREGLTCVNVETNPDADEMP